MRVDVKKATMVSVALGFTLLLTGCGGPSGSVALKNPNFFSFQSRDQVLSGLYNPAGYSQEVVRAQIRAACKGETLQSYGEQPTENGLVAFNATCRNGTILETGAYEVERRADGNYIFEAFGG